MTLVTIKNPDGTRFNGCECIAKIWDDLNEVARSRGIVKSNFDVLQGSYNTSVSKSALTHSQGGTLDLRLIVGKEQEMDDLLEEFGFASYQRGPRSYDGFDPHFHVVLCHCPHLHWQAANQVTSWKNGRDGLVRNWLDRDKTRPKAVRTTAEALIWAKAAVGASAAPVSLGSLNRAAKGDATKNKSHVMILQTRLRELGFYKFVPDGKFGPETRKALNAYRWSLNYSRARATAQTIDFGTWQRLLKNDKRWKAAR